MPTYAFYCVLCGDFEQWRSIHDGPLEECPECGNTVALVLHPPALYGIGSRGAETRRADGKEKNWSKDMPAYARLRSEGHQPRRIDGSHELEQTAVGNWHIKTGQAHKDEVVNSAMEQARDIVRHG
jgi:putative FmdB family regulatory protein